VPYVSASGVVFHEEALYQVYVPLPLPIPGTVVTYACKLLAFILVVMHLSYGNVSVLVSNVTVIMSC